MGGKKSSAPIAAAPEPRTPDVNIAQEAAKRALEAQGNVAAAGAAANDDEKKRPGDMMMGHPNPGAGMKPKRPRDAGSMMGSGGTGMQQSGVLTG